MVRPVSMATGSSFIPASMAMHVLARRSSPAEPRRTRAGRISAMPVTGLDREANVPVPECIVSVRLQTIPPSALNQLHDRTGAASLVPRASGTLLPNPFTVVVSMADAHEHPDRAEMGACGFRLRGRSGSFCSVPREVLYFLPLPLTFIGFPGRHCGKPQKPPGAPAATARPMVGITPAMDSHIPKILNHRHRAESGAAARLPPAAAGRHRSRSRLGIEDGEE